MGATNEVLEALQAILGQQQPHHEVSSQVLDALSKLGIKAPCAETTETTTAPCATGGDGETLTKVIETLSEIMRALPRSTASTSADISPCPKVTTTVSETETTTVSEDEATTSARALSSPFSEEVDDPVVQMVKPHKPCLKKKPVVRSQAQLTRTFLATGCTNPTPDTELVDWWMKQSGGTILNDMFRYCTFNSANTASPNQIRQCCGSEATAESCNPSCTKQADFADVSPVAPPVMRIHEVNHGCEGDYATAVMPKKRDERTITANLTSDNAGVPFRLQYLRNTQCVSFALKNDNRGCDQGGCRGPANLVTDASLEACDGKSMYQTFMFHNKFLRFNSSRCVTIDLSKARGSCAPLTLANCCAENTHQMWTKEVSSTSQGDVVLFRNPETGLHIDEVNLVTKQLWSCPGKHSFFVQEQLPSSSNPMLEPVPVCFG